MTWEGRPPERPPTHGADPGVSGIRAARTAVAGFNARRNKSNGPMIDPIDPATEARAAQLLEQRRLAPLDADERGELDAIFDAHPGLRAMADDLDREDVAMHATIHAAVDHFDFEKSRRAVEAQRRIARTYFRMFCLICGGALAATAAAAALGLASRSLVIMMALAWSVPLCLIGLTIHHRRTHAARIASGDPEAARAAFDAHLRAGRTERTVMQAVGVVAGLGLTVAVIDSIVNADYLRAVVLIVAFVLVYHGIWNRYASPRARRRHERLLAGDINDTAWIRGEDRPA